MRKGFQDICQQHSRYGQGGLCDDSDDYCDEGSAGSEKMSIVFSSSLADTHGTRALKFVSKFMFARDAKMD